MALQGSLRFGPFRIDSSRQLLTRDERTIHLRPKTWELLCYLAERPGVLVSHDELLTQLWGDTAVQPQALTRLVFELRQALESDAGTRIDNIARRGYRFVAEIARDVALAAPSAPAEAALPLLIGRASDIAVLDTCWQRARAARRQIVFICGEAGIGKTTLVNTFIENLTGVLVARGQCPRKHGEAEPYMALLDAIERIGERIDLTPVLRRFAPAWLVQMPWLIAPEETQSLRQSLAGIGEARMLREGIRLLEALSAERPLVLVLEDLHWSDAATVDLLRALGERTNAAQLLVIGTYRTTELAMGMHPLREAVSHLVHRGGAASRLILESFGPASVHAYLAERFASDELARTLAPIVERKSGGNPLFLSSLTDCLVDGGSIVRRDAAWVLSAAPESLDVNLPDGLREIIGEQLARLPQDWCELLEAASAAGEEFTAHELAAALQRSEGEVESTCIDLAQRGQFMRHTGERAWPDGSTAQTFQLAHILIGQAVAERIAPLRRRMLHERIGERLEAAYGAQVIEIAGRLASIFEAAGNVEKQAQYFELAAQRAYQRFAYREVGECLAQAIAAIRLLPAAPERTRREATRWLDLGNISIVAFGFCDRRARAAFDHAWQLASAAGEELMTFRAQLGRCITQLMAAFPTDPGQLDELTQLAGSLIDMAQDGHPELLAVAHLYNALVDQGTGAARAALDHCVAGREHLAAAMPGVPRDADLETTLSVVEALALGPLGFIADSRRYSAHALERLDSLTLPQQQVSAHTMLAEAALARRDDALAFDLAEAAIAIATESGVGNYVSLARALRACTRLGIDADAAETVDKVLRTRHAIGERWDETLILARLAAFYRSVGDFERSLRVTGELGPMQEPKFGVELLRERAETLLAQQEGQGRRPARAARHRDTSEAESCLRKAIEMARAQEALLYESRAAVTLGRLLLATDRRAEALSLVGDVHSRFPPVQDSADLHDLDTFLLELRDSTSRSKTRR